MDDRVGAVRLALDGVDLTDPAQAFGFGLAYGRALERELVDQEDELVHRAAVKTIRRHVGWHDARDL